MGSGNDVCLEKGVMPDIDVPMDMAPIGYIADCVCEILEERAAGRLDGHTWLELFAPNGLYFRDVKAALLRYLVDRPPRLVPMAEFAHHFRDVLCVAGSPQSMSLSTLLTTNFVPQITTVMTGGPNTYRSQKNGVPPKMGTAYLDELVQTIDKKMVLT